MVDDVFDVVDVLAVDDVLDDVEDALVVDDVLDEVVLDLRVLEAVVDGGRHWEYLQEKCKG